jgi:DNA-directed RNA polymerase specialized sigma24 family protein
MAQEAPFMITDLYWLAFLLTGRRDISIDIVADAILQNKANPFFTSWMTAWSRRIVIAKALTEIRQELAVSARRTQTARIKKSVSPPRNWSLSPDTTKARIEDALLAIDLFPRAAVLLSIFENIPAVDAATLLDADVPLVRKAIAIGLRELTANLAQERNRPAPGFCSALAWGTSN